MKFFLKTSIKRMPSIDLSFLQNLQENWKSFSCFVETGTLHGGTIFAMEPYFNDLFTIEVSEKYYNSTKSKYNGKKINFLLGDSSVVFETLLPTINNKSIFFLDGHWSGGDTGKSAKDCPLLEEVGLINNLFKHEAIIIIDDVRLFGKKVNEDWSQITEESLLNILNKRLLNSYGLSSEYAENDRLILHIAAV